MGEIALSPSFPRGVRLRVALLAAILLFSACSGGDDDDSETSPSSAQNGVTSAQSDIRPAAKTWAEAAVAKYAEQIAADGKTDYTAVIKSISESTATLNSSICSAVKKNVEVGKSEITTSLEQDLLTVVDEATMTLIAQHSDLLFELGMTTWGTWPPFVLKDPAPAADTPVEGLPSSLQQYVKPEFLFESTGIKLPGPSDASYDEFQSWYSLDGENKLYEQASATSAPVRDGLRTCLDGIQGE